jgi:2-(1,2-epoxy-1,2-dihydrophenyl)acetyl-CoA isomerase
MTDHSFGPQEDLSTPEVGVGLDESTHVGTIEIHRGPHNFLDGEVLARVVEVSHELATRGGRALVLCSEGKNFCAGANFASGAGASGRGDEVYATGIRILEQPLPIVAALQGSTIGAGVGLALVADLRVASPESRFSTNFALLGLHHGFGLSVTLPLVVGHQAAIQLLYTGRRIDGEEAYRIGLCDYLVPADEIRRRATTLATEIAASAPLATQAIRRSMRGHLADEMRTAMASEYALQQELTATSDFAEGTTAVNERRPGRFTGQ